MADDADKAGESLDLYQRVREGNRVIYEGVSAYKCESCGDPIPQGRRDAIPGVTLCVFCKEMGD